MLKQPPHYIKALTKAVIRTTVKLVLGLSLFMAASTGSDAHEMHLQLGCLPPPSAALAGPNRAPLENGLWLDTSGGELQAIAVVGAKQVTVVSASDPKTIELKIRDLTAQKLVQLRKQYGVLVFADGQSLRTQDLRQLCTRRPTLSELLSLELALSHAHSPPCKRDSHCLQICFLTEVTGSQKLAEWSLDAARKPVITVQSNASTSTSLESLFLHELGHHSQYRMGLDPARFGQWKTARKLGWHYFKNPSTAEEGWAILTKENHLFKFTPRLRKWVRCNERGQILGSDGARVKHQYEAEQRDAFNISRTALIRPATGYFTNPAEVLAEGTMLYRLNEQSRSYLQSVSPELYEFVEAEDRAELDKVYGTGKKIRLPCGVVADSKALPEQSVRLAAEH